MSIEKCLSGLIAQKRISREQADDIMAMVADFERDFARSMGPAEAAAAAASAAAQELERAASIAEKQAALQIIAQARVVADAGSHKDGWFAGVASIFARDIWGRAGYSNVEARSKAILGTLHGMFVDGLSDFRTKVAGLSNDKIGLTRLVREIYGENSGDTAARAAAAGWNEATDYAAKRFNGAGGDLRRLETWRLPQHWDRSKVVAGGQATFEDFMHQARAEGRLRIVDWKTGRPVTDERARQIITDAYASIDTNGLNKLVPGQSAFPKLANARQERRAFEWTNADAWLDFNRRYGVGDAQILDLLTGHLDGISRDIAQLEILGPNPDATARVLIDNAKKNGVSALKVYRLEAIWDHVTGEAMSPVSETLANWGRGIRSWLTSAQLGSAVLSSTADFAVLERTAAFNGLPATQVMTRYLSLLNPANEADKKLAVRLGLIAEGWATRAAGATRHQAEVVGHDLPGKVAEVVLRASGLQAHTQAARWAFGMEMLGHIADFAKTKFDALPAELRAGFARHGVDEADWNIIRKGPAYEDGGVRFIWPEALAKVDDAHMNAASRLMEFVNTEMDFAIPVPGAIERSLLLGKSRPGTYSGEFLRAMAQYKSFPVTIMMTHMMRAASEIQGGDWGRYLASTTLSMTVAGAFAVQLKAIAQGKDPRDMSDPKFWGAAFVQGGGAGIMGDFLYAGLNRADQSFYMTAIGGPTAGLVDDLARLTGGNISASAEGRDANFGADLARFVRRNVPGSSLWYARLAMDRLVFDELQRAADPNYSEAFSRMEQRAFDDYRQEYWWRPGDAAPQRAPQLP